MGKSPSTDFDTYRQIMGELLQPISAEGLDAETIKRLYESKLVYLENLRVKCFSEVNGSDDSHFTTDDYKLILDAVHQTRHHLRNLILVTITNNLARRAV